MIELNIEDYCQDSKLVLINCMLVISRQIYSSIAITSLSATVFIIIY